MKEKHIYIIGSKGIPAKYGGFETFVEKLTANRLNNQLTYHVACTKENSLKSGIQEKTFVYQEAQCFTIDVPNIGPAKAIYYDVAALNYAIQEAEKENYQQPIFYVLACRIGPFIQGFKKRIEKISGQLFLNPDGHEWLRAKWSYPVRRYWKLSERLMVKHADLVICDSQTIEKYIQKSYARFQPKTTYIAYGSDIPQHYSKASEPKVRKWFADNQIREKEYYLIVGRFVPENNYRVMIEQFMQSTSQKDLVIITNVENNKLYQELLQQTEFTKDSRIKFVGTVYDQALLNYIRVAAYGYLHGHEVGGTNPSLLEALATTQLNLLLNVGFNYEVGQAAAIYWSKNNLAEIIAKVEQYSPQKIAQFKEQAVARIQQDFSWQKINQQYESCFNEGV